MHKTPGIIYLGIDIQKAFGKEALSPRLKLLASHPEGDEDREVEANARLATSVYAAGGLVVVSRDWHNPVGTVLEGPGGSRIIDNRSVEEFERYGVHATPGTGDSELNAPLQIALRQLEQRDGHARRVIPVDEHEGPPASQVSVGGGSQRIVEVHKNMYDVTRKHALRDGAAQGPIEPHTEVVALLRAQPAESTVILGGKIAEVCVRATGLSILTELPKLRLVVARDAVSSLPSEVSHSLGMPGKDQVMEELRSRGARLQSTAEILEWLRSECLSPI